MEQRNILGESCKKQIIFGTETLCAILAYPLFTSMLVSRMCFLYVDNEATKYSVMKGTSENLTVDVMSEFFAKIETHIHTLCWITRVSSFSNIADANEFGFCDKSCEASKCLNALCLAIRDKLGKTAGQMIRHNPA